MNWDSDIQSSDSDYSAVDDPEDVAKMKQSGGRVLSLRAAAYVLGVDERAVVRAITSGELRAFKVGSRKWHIRTSDLNRYVRRQINKWSREHSRNEQ